MPYVRMQGHQIAILHNTRGAGPRVLFTLHSRPDAEAAMGDAAWRHLLESRHPTVRFDWSAIEADITALSRGLPDDHPSTDLGAARDVRSAVVELFRALLVTDPLEHATLLPAIEGQRLELELLGELIDDRLSSRKLLQYFDVAPGTEFSWGARTAALAVPAEAMDWIRRLRRDDFDEDAEALAKIVADAWPERVEGHLALGQIALDRGEMDTAIARFQSAMDVARKVRPRQLPRDQRWGRFSRSFVEAMRGTTFALLRIGRYLDALRWSHRLADECEDHISFVRYAAAALVNLGRWEESLELAEPWLTMMPDQGFVCACAALERGDHGGAVAYFLCGAIAHPGLARIALGQEGEDDGPADAGEIVKHVLGRWFAQEPLHSQFSTILATREVVALQGDYRRRNKNRKRRPGDIGTIEFARRKAAELSWIFET